MADVFEVLKEQGITYDRYDHVAVFTTAEADAACRNLPGKQAKNLFLTNDKGDKHFLVTIAHDKRADLKQLASIVGEKRLRFASPERLMNYLGITPGSVSPLGLINDVNREVRFLMDSELLAQEKVFIHPNINTATLGIATHDFLKLMASLGYEVRVLNV